MWCTCNKNRKLLISCFPIICWVERFSNEVFVWEIRYDARSARARVLGTIAERDRDSRKGYQVAVLRQTSGILQGFYIWWYQHLKSSSEKSLLLLKVAWIYMERSAILTVQNHIITRNPRISVSHDQHHTWNLHIANVQESDRGGYMYNHQYYLKNRNNLF